MLLNYNGTYNDMSTVAHEFGHSMQSYLSNKNQPYATSQYPIFVAEVASTFNEALLIDYMLKQIKDDNARLSLLGSYLENIKGTVFRQTQFAEFELRIHEMAEKGEPLTGDVLNKVYDEIVKKYYGHDKNVCIVDDEIKAEWMYIPHFYYNFYVINMQLHTQHHLHYLNARLLVIKRQQISISNSSPPVDPIIQFHY